MENTEDLRKRFLVTETLLLLVKGHIFGPIVILKGYQDPDLREEWA